MRTHGRRFRALLGWTVVGITVGCAPPDVRLTAPSSASAVTAGTQDAKVDALAKGIAVAMSDVAIRSQIRAAMRESRFTDHKLVLQQYLASSAGRRFLDATATALGLSAQELSTLAAAVEPLDFYVPFRTHRLAWRGTPDVIVGSTLDLDAPTIVAYDGEGNPRTLALADGTPQQPLVILHPAEPKAMISPNQPRGANGEIQAPGEVTIASVEPCPGGVCDDGGGGGGGSTLSPGVYLTQFQSPRGDGWGGSLEMEFRSYAVNYPIYYDYFAGYWLVGSSCPKGTGLSTWQSGENYTNQRLLVSPNTYIGAVSCATTGAVYELYMWEMDGGLNGNNDDFGMRFFAAGTTPFGARPGYSETYYASPGQPYGGEYSGTATLMQVY